MIFKIYSANGFEHFEFYRGDKLLYQKQAPIGETVCEIAHHNPKLTIEELEKLNCQLIELVKINDFYNKLSKLDNPFYVFLQNGMKSKDDFIKIIDDLQLLLPLMNEQKSKNYTENKLKFPVSSDLDVDLIFEPVIISEGMIITDVLYTDNITEMYKFLIQILLKENAKIRKCKNCKRYFSLPADGRFEYCNRKIDNSKYTCREAGAMRVYRNNPFNQVYNNACKTTNSHLRSGKITSEEFEVWAEFAKSLLKTAKKGNISVEEFERKLII